MGKLKLGEISLPTGFQISKKTLQLLCSFFYALYSLTIHDSLNEALPNYNEPIVVLAENDGNVAT